MPDHKNGSRKSRMSLAATQLLPGAHFGAPSVRGIKHKEIAIAKAKVYTGFLPPKALNLSAEEKAAAIRVLRRLESGKIVGRDDNFGEPIGPENKAQFDMDEVFLEIEDREGHCGSVGCLAGWIAFELNIGDANDKSDFYRDLYNRSSALDELFHAADNESGSMWNARAEPKHGARALRSFLKTGKAHWRKAMRAQA